MDCCNFRRFSVCRRARMHRTRVDDPSGDKVCWNGHALDHCQVYSRFYSNSCYNDFSVFRFTKTIRIAVFLSRFFKLTKFQNVFLPISNSLWNINQTFISWNFVANRNSSNLKIICVILSGLLVYPVTKPRSWITAGSMAPEFRSLSSSCAHSIRHCQTSKQAGVVNYQYY